MIMNPVIALLLASSSTSAVINWGTAPGSLQFSDAVITTLKDAVQNKPATDPAVTAGLTCDADDTNRVLSNSQDNSGTAGTTWPDNTCESSCFSTNAEAATGMAATDVPTWTVNLGGQYLLSHVQVLMGKDPTGGITATRLCPNDVSVSDTLDGTYASQGVFTVAGAVFEQVQTFVENSPVSASFLRLTANHIDKSSSAGTDTAQMAFCGIQVYGTKTPKQLAIEATTAELATCEGDLATLETEKDTLTGEIQTLTTEKSTLATEKAALATAKSTLVTEKAAIVTAKTAVEATRDSYVNPEEKCGGMKFFGRQFCKTPEKAE